MVTITPTAIAKVKEVAAAQSPAQTAIRIGVRGGGCSGFQYAMVFDSSEPTESDEVLDFAGFRVFVDQMSLMYLDGVTIDYIDTLEASGFKFENPNVKTTCGCGQSFSV
jgi:iron-sulfur cluster assembly accessory protein